MRNINLDVLHSKLDKHILLVQSYTEISELVFIIKSCRLKPYKYIFEEKSSKLILYHWWFDEFSNTFQLVKKNPQIIYHDLRLPRKEIVSTDLYYGLTIDKIAKISKLGFFAFGKDEDLYQDCAFITFLGLDNYLRSFIYLYGEWQQVSPLLLGLQNLRMLSQNRDMKLFRKLDIKENCAIPCISAEQWLTYMPPHKEFMSMLNVHSQPIYSIMNNTKEQ